jgi:hypothetical protein
MKIQIFNETLDECMYNLCHILLALIILAAILLFNMQAVVILVNMCQFLCFGPDIGCDWNLKSKDMVL